MPAKDRYHDVAKNALVKLLIFNDNEEIVRWIR